MVWKKRKGHDSTAFKKQNVIHDVTHDVTRMLCISTAVSTNDSRDRQSRSVLSVVCLSRTEEVLAEGGGGVGGARDVSLSQ